MTERIYAKYLIETDQDVRQAAAVMAGEQSAGTFVKVPGETPELLEKYGARVENLEVVGEVDTPSLPRRMPHVQGTVFRQAEVTLSFPFANIGPSLTALWTAVAGNLFELSPFTGLRLLDIEVPTEFGRVYPGPAYGIAGTRKLLDIYERPVIGTIIKPSVGLSVAQLADLVQTLCEAGLDFIKDDELQSDPPYAPLEARVKSVMQVVNDHAERTGKKVMVAFNITGDIDHMLRAHDLVKQHGGNCVMVNLLAVGLTGLTHLRRHCELPIHGHRAGWGMLSRHPMLGMDYRAFQKFFRLAGVDHLHVNGLRNKFCEPDESVITAAQVCLTPLPGLDYRVMPVFSSGQWAGQAPDTYAALGTSDLLYLAGGGIMGHPAGVSAGVRSLQQGWEAAVQGIQLSEYAVDHMELAQALEKYGALDIH